MIKRIKNNYQNNLSIDFIAEKWIGILFAHIQSKRISKKTNLNNKIK